MYAHVFRNVHEMNDMLFMCRYYVEYVTEPVEDSSEAFYFAIEDPVTGHFPLQRKFPEDGYGHNVQMIYVSAADVVSLGMVWAGNYNAVITSSPTLFSTVYEDSMFLDFDSWSESSSVVAGQENLRLGILSQSKALEKVSSLILTQSTANGYKLSIEGKNFWQLRYDGTSQIPDLSVTSSQYMTVDNLTFMGSYLEELSGSGSMFGSTTTIKDSFTVLADTVGIPYWQIVAFIVLCVPSFMIISGTVYGVSGNTKMAAIIAAPMMFVMTMLIPDALLMILTAIVAFIVVVVMWRFV
jgi:hypothetical protein